MELTDEQWAIEPLFPKVPRRADAEDPDCPIGILDGILWILRTGALGTIYLTGILIPDLAIGVSRSGVRRASLKPSCGRWPRTYASAAV